MGSLNKMKKLLLLFAVATYVSAAAVPKLRVPPAVKVYEHNYGKREAEADQLIDFGQAEAGYIVDDYPADDYYPMDTYPADDYYPMDTYPVDDYYPLDTYPLDYGFDDNGGMWSY